MEWFDPDVVKAGDLIYLNVWYLDWFTQHVHDQIKHPYLLLTSDVGGWSPHPDWERLLYDSKLAAWFCRGLVFSYHPKLFQIPMGQDIHLFHPEINHLVDVLLDAHEKKDSSIKWHLLYSNFYRRPHGDRKKIGRFFDTQPYCYTDPAKATNEFYEDLAVSKFTLSPFGLESDCVRTWEALAFDSIPIVEYSFLDPLFKDMPVLLVFDWTEINAALLEEKYRELQHLDRTKAYFPFWEKLIKDTQKKVREGDTSFSELEATAFDEEDFEKISSILEKRDGPLLYKGFLSTIRPFQLSNQRPVALYDPWLNQTNYYNLCCRTFSYNSMQRLPSENAFAKATQVESPVTIFLDFTYYRTSLILTFQTSICELDNFRHNLKIDLENLYDSIALDSLIFGNMSDEPYVKEVLDRFSKDNDVQIKKNGSFWSVLKTKKIVPLEEQFPNAYSAITEPLALTKDADWPTPALDQFCDPANINHAVIVGKIPLHLCQLVSSQGKIFVVNPWEDPMEYQQFLSNVIHTGAASQIIPVQMEGKRAAYNKVLQLNLPIDLVYLNALETQFYPLQILEAWYPLVKKEGIFCGEGWENSEIQQDIKFFAAKHSRVILDGGDFWMLW